MRSAQLVMQVGGIDPGAAFDRIQDFARYPELVNVVRSVVVHQIAEDRKTSDWEVFFRNGILRWSEADRMDRAGLTISFNQLDGDFAEFSGIWRISDDAAGCSVAFDAEFDFGIPSLAGILDPVAERVLKETIAEIISALFDNTTILTDSALAAGVAATSAVGKAARW